MIQRGSRKPLKVPPAIPDDSIPVSHRLLAATKHAIDAWHRFGPPLMDTVLLVAQLQPDAVPPLVLFLVSVARNADRRISEVRERIPSTAVATADRRTRGR